MKRAAGRPRARIAARRRWRWPLARTALLVALAGRLRRRPRSLAAPGAPAGAAAVRPRRAAHRSAGGRRHARSRRQPRTPGWPSRRHSHTAAVLSVSAPEGGQQRAVLELQPPEPADHVYALAAALPDHRPDRRQSPSTAGSSRHLRRRLRRLPRAQRHSRHAPDACVRCALAPTAHRSRRSRASGARPRTAHPPCCPSHRRAWRRRWRSACATSSRARSATTSATPVLSHVVAISGWHIALRRRRRRRSARRLASPSAVAARAAGDRLLRAPRGRVAEHPARRA